VEAAGESRATPNPSRLGPDPRTVIEAAYDAHQREIYSFALRSTRDADAAADVAQEAFLRLLRELHEGRPPDNVRAWLYRVSTNLVINAARHTSALDRVRHILARPESTIESPERGAVQRERNRAVEAALNRLSPDARTGLLLAAKGFSGREIAAAIGRSELATRSLMCRARLDLREQLEPFDPLGEASA
jgi:RNA polymerase sigma-70 factor (ECF subfamily)